MKRVFAFLSAFVFALVLFGTTTYAADPEPAAGKFIVDPTLTADEIPLYVMDSIYTTFPNFYDHVAKPDTKYQTGRLYPWNETRILVPQYAQGVPTGKTYSVYFTGGLTYQDANGAPINQAGNNRHFVTATMNDKIVYQTGFEASEPAAFAAATVYNNAVAATQGTGTQTWDMVFGTVSTTGAIIGTQSAQMRWYVATPEALGSLVSNFTVNNVDKVIFNSAQTEGLKVKVSHSVDGGDFVGAQVFEPALTSTEFTYNVNKTGAVKIKFEVELPAVLPTATSRLYIDNVRIISGKEGATTANQSAPASASLSFLRMNNLGGDVWYNTVHETNNNANIAYLLFSKEGKALRGIAPVSSILEKYCYAAAPATGLIEVTEEFTGCEMLLDGENNPIGPKYFSGRIVWDAQVNPTDHPDKFNANGYLGTDWDANKWDYYDAEAQVAYSFYAGGDANYGVMTADEIAFHNAQPANAANQLAAGVRRQVVQYFNFPDKALFYSFAFLDRGTAMMASYLDMYWTGMKHGRDAEYNMQFKTYDFSPQAVLPVNSGALIPMEGITPVTIEVLQGSTFVPRNNVNFDALGKYWGTPNDFTGYVSDLTKLQHTVTVNGATVAMPSSWTTKQQMIDEFYAEWNAWVIANRSDRYGPGKTIELITPANAYAERYSMISETSGANMWWHHDRAAAQKWMFLITFISNVRASQVPALATAAFNTNTLAAGVSTSSGTVMNELLAYFAQEHRTAWPATSNYTTGYSTLPGALSVNPLTYSIDTTGKAPGYMYNLDWRTKNTVTGTEFTLRIKYVVTNVYTPRIQVNNLALLKSQGDAFNIRSIATATDGYGNDISQYLVFSTDKEFNAKALQAGTYPITISIVDQYFGIKRAEKQVFLKVADLTAPVVSTRNLVLPFGALFNIRDGFVTAYDNVDGNLLGAQDFNPFVEMSDPIPANRAGLYVVEYEVYDRTGNSTSGVFTVRVLADFNTQIMDKLNTLSTTAQMNTMKTELLAALATLESGTEADILAARNHLATLIGDLGDDVDTSVTGAKTALETLINNILGDLEVTVVEAVEAIPAQDNTATIVTGSAATVSSLGVGAGVIILLLKRR
ncbi:MAG TPA: hypothetical protein PLR26_05100 [Bacilli bacterium]|nr:hypothetical protein [Bacilli bacterium]